MNGLGDGQMSAVDRNPCVHGVCGPYRNRASEDKGGCGDRKLGRTSLPEWLGCLVTRVGPWE